MIVEKCYYQQNKHRSAPK